MAQPALQAEIAALIQHLLAAIFRRSMARDELAAPPRRARLAAEVSR
jgi:hypothetical protein